MSSEVLLEEPASLLSFCREMQNLNLFTPKKQLEVMLKSTQRLIDERRVVVVSGDGTTVCLLGIERRPVTDK